MADSQRYKKWRLEHPLEYRVRNKLQARKWRAKNPDYNRAYQKIYHSEYYYNNRERLLTYQKEWYKRNPGKAAEKGDTGCRS